MTREELEQLSKDTFFDNDNGEIQPAGHRNFNSKLLDFIVACKEAAHQFTTEKLAELVNGSPEQLDTLYELAEALGNDPNFAATVMQKIGERVTSEALAAALTGKANKVHTHTAEDVSGVLKYNGVVQNTDLASDETAKLGTGIYAIQYNGFKGILISFSMAGAASPLQFVIERYNSPVLKYRLGVDNIAFIDREFKTIYDSSNLKPTYYAQIDANGNVVSKSDDWIQSVGWVVVGNNRRCDIYPKKAINTNTIQITVVMPSNGSPNCLTPIVQIVSNAITEGTFSLYIVDTDKISHASSFNVSVQGV